MAAAAPLEVERILVGSPDGATSTLSVRAAADPKAPVILCLPAMGIEARFYSVLATDLVQAGFGCAVLELRGLGTSSVRASRSVDFGYATMAELDLPAAIDAVRERFPAAPLVLLGHSLGGQVAVLHLALGSGSGVRGLVLVASGMPWWRLWPVPLRYLLYAMGWVFPWTARALGFFPGRHLAFAGREARGVMADWGHIARTGRFVARGWTGPDPEEGLTSVRLPVLAISLEQDRFTPRRTVEYMVAKLPSAAVELFHYDHRAHGEPPVDHIRWPRHPRVIVERTADWLGRLPLEGRESSGGRETTKA